MKAAIPLAFLVIGVVAVSGCTSLVGACTQDAKVCPDGSVVGRVAPFCEFAECPDIPEEYLNTLYCESDSDCRAQATACHGCGCPVAINLYHWESLDCEPSEFGCDLFCEQTVPACVDNECILTS